MNLKRPSYLRHYLFTRPDCTDVGPLLSLEFDLIVESVHHPVRM